MDKTRKDISDKKKKKEKDPKSNAEKQTIEDKIDKELEQSFPASDPPSYSQPGNDYINDYK